MDEDILFLDSTGKVTPKSSINHLIANEGKISDLTITNKLISKSIQFVQPLSSDWDTSVVTTDRHGLLQLTSELEIKSLKIQKKLIVNEDIETSGLKIHNLKSTSSGSGVAFLISDQNGHISSSNQITVTSDGAVKIRDFAAEQLKEDLNINKKKLYNGIISKSEIVDSDIVISSSDSKRGFDESSLAIVDQVCLSLSCSFITPPITPLPLLLSLHQFFFL